MFDLGFSLALMRWPDAGVSQEARFLVTAFAAVLACSFLYWRARAHRYRLARIPIRIHVAGTRGKSATVRLIATGLRAGGHTVVAKVTGTRPRLLLADGTEQPVRRWGPAAIREQRALVSLAATVGADVIVAEAMAIQPEYLQALERFYIRATDLVVVNVRPDHQEQLGTAPDAMARAVAECIAPGQRVFLSSAADVPAITERARQEKCELLLVDTGSADPLDENRQLALAVCRQYGVSAAAAEPAMRSASVDTGQFFLMRLNVGERQVEFANAFSCNDVESLSRLWERYHPPGRETAFLLNPRVDRPIRTIEFLKQLARLAPAAQLFISSSDPAVRRRAIAQGFVPEKVHRVSPRMTELVVNALVARMPEGAVLWGVGNYAGAGARFLTRVRSDAPC
jgi:poly-gamma-glutamate synthase PgsB/CapB